MARARATTGITPLMAGIWQWLVQQGPDEIIRFWREPRDPFILGVFFGILAILAVYHLLLYLSLRDPSYLAYALVLVSQIGLLSVVEGLVQRQVLGNDLPLVNNLLSLGFSLLLMIWLTQFSRAILTTGRVLPAADRVLVGLIVFDTANLLLWVTILGAAQSTYPVQFVLPYIGVLHTAVLVTVGIISALRRVPFAGLYLAGWVLAATGSSVQILREDQLVADNLATRYAYYWGVLGQISCLSLAVSFRLDRMRQHREQQTRKLMEADKLVSIGTMASSLGHEIANPTGAIASNAAFLRKYYEHVVPLLDSAQESGDDGLIGDLPHRSGARPDAARHRGNRAQCRSHRRHHLRAQEILPAHARGAYRDGGPERRGGFGSGRLRSPGQTPRHSAADGARAVTAAGGGQFATARAGAGEPAVERGRSDPGSARRRR